MAALVPGAVVLLYAQGGGCAGEVMVKSAMWKADPTPTTATTPCSVRPGGWAPPACTTYELMVVEVPGRWLKGWGTQGSGLPSCEQGTKNPDSGCVGSHWPIMGVKSL